MGIATVYQDLALVSLMSVTRNFFMGREPMKGPPFFKTFDIEKANKIAAERMGQIGIDIRDPSQAVGPMSGGERQCLAISRAIYFGAIAPKYIALLIAKHCLSPPDIGPTAWDGSLMSIPICPILSAAILFAFSISNVLKKGGPFIGSLPIKKFLVTLIKDTKAKS